MNRQAAVAALAYAMWDAEHTVRLEYPEDQQLYFKKAEKLLESISRFRSKKERLDLSIVIRKTSPHGTSSS